MARHVNKHSRQFIPEKDVQEQILDIHPVPTNINKPPELDPVLETMLKSRYKNECIKEDDNLKRTQVKIRDALGPLSKVWSLMEDLIHNNEVKRFMDTQEVGEAIEQTNLLLGQAQVSLLYYRRMNILTELSSNSQAKGAQGSH